MELAYICIGIPVLACVFMLLFFLASASLSGKAIAEDKRKEAERQVELELLRKIAHQKEDA